MPSPVPKPSDRRQGRGTASLVVHGGAGRAVPEPPRGLLKDTRGWWAGLWASPLSGTWEDSDVPALRRLAQLYDERERAYRAFRKQRIVAGSQGQPRLNPLGKFVGELDSEIRNLEDRFGLSPMARLRLGVQFGEMHRSLDDMNRRLAVDVDEDDPLLEALDDEQSAQDDGPASRRVG